MSNNLENKGFKSDPKYSGPGIWWFLHRMAWLIKDQKDTDYLIGWLYELAHRSHPCPKCRTHMSEYLQNNDVNDYRNERDSDGKLIGMFRYMWEFHNSVNKRLGYPIYPWNEAIEYQKNLASNPFCDTSCGSDSEDSAIEEEEFKEEMQKAPPSPNMFIKKSHSPVSKSNVRTNIPSSSTSKIPINIASTSQASRNINNGLWSYGQ